MSNVQIQTLDNKQKKIDKVENTLYFRAYILLCIDTKMRKLPGRK